MTALYQLQCCHLAVDIFSMLRALSPLLGVVRSARRLKLFTHSAVFNYVFVMRHLQPKTELNLSFFSDI